MDDLEAIKNFLGELVERRLAQESKDWLESQIQKIQQTDKPGPFYLALSGVPRHVGKGELDLTAQDLDQADSLRAGFHPGGWTMDRVCRALLILSLSRQKDFFLKTIETLFSTADMNEQAALYASLAVIPFPEEFTKRAAEGIRTNILPVFDAIALDNPYPSNYLEDAPWNQMVLKAAFMDRPIYRIQGLEKRANADLAKIISDFAHERWAAHRNVSPEFWRPVAKFVDEPILQDIKTLFGDKDKLQHDAACLVCHQSDHEEARALLEERGDQLARIRSQELNWDSLANEWWTRKNQGNLS